MRNKYDDPGGLPMHRTGDSITDTRDQNSTTWQINTLRIAEKLPAGVLPPHASRPMDEGLDEGLDHAPKVLNGDKNWIIRNYTPWNALAASLCVWFII